MTSQVLANIYLHEFDWFVRHRLKPLAYVRYGDDFILFAQTHEVAEQFRKIATSWLFDNLHLTVHKSNNHVFQVKRGIHILGHRIYPKHQIVIDPAMLRRIHKKLNRTNTSTYKSLQMPKRQKELLSHLLINLKQ